MAAIAVRLLTMWFLLEVGTCAERPIVGILTQELSNNSTTTSYIAASYVKAAEAAGARVVPVFLRRSIFYYRDLLLKINGLILPGGAAPRDTEGGYFDTAARLYAVAKEMNRSGIRFPILGVCQGFEALALISNNMKEETLTVCNGMDGVMLPLEFKKGFRHSSLYRDASSEIIITLSTKNVTPNYHTWCLRPNKKLKEPWRILSVNKDADGLEFVSSMENGHFAGVQFHPEKCAYEWKQDNPSFKSALLAARHFYDWLLTEARKNDNHFPSPEEEDNAVIYNYDPEYSGKKGGSFEQVYLFKDG